MPRQESRSLRDFFFRLTQRTFGELGLSDLEIVNYLADVLTEFARTDRLYRVHSASGKRLDFVDMLAVSQANASADPLVRQRAMRQYVGDHTLFMSGLFRSYVEQHGILNLYLEKGRDSYWKVSELDIALCNTDFPLFQELAKKFEYYSGALDYMRKTHFAPSPGQHVFADFLKQVERWVGVGTSSN